MAAARSPRAAESHPAMVGTSTPAPPRGTRPRNRRALIIAAANDLFYTRGYPHVSIADVAEAVAVAPSALYRHFRGKQEILVAVLTDALDAVSASFAGALDGPSDDLSHGLAETALANRQLGVLWARELRHVEDRATRRALAGTIRAVAAALIAQVEVRRPDLSAEQAELVGWAVISSLVSLSFHQVRLPGDGLVALLADIVDAVLDTRIPTTGVVPREVAADEAPVPRREQLLDAAIDLFAARGYHAVGIEDIGAAAGIDGTGIYRHYGTKADLLVAAMVRGADVLQSDLRQALACAPTPSDGLPALVSSYAGFAMRSPDLVSLLFSEVAHLPTKERQRIVQVQRDYIAHWISLLAVIRDETPLQLRVRVHAALTMTNVIARRPQLHRLPETPGALVAFGVAALRCT